MTIVTSHIKTTLIRKSSTHIVIKSETRIPNILEDKYLKIAELISLTAPLPRGVFPLDREVSNFIKLLIICRYHRANQKARIKSSLNLIKRVGLAAYDDFCVQL
ncbi:hypothetical protein BED35_07170 [Yersinia enterocolitica]|uniref:Uncharacterized protein n=1 Tax=Yersinia enterocolitica TaxID=630 RepID=A0ABM9SIJ8_YEREN|nr:hypothetical protein BED34_06720 [Yersinia enterocolitica]AOF22881.1 hypothetical protein BED33_09380 [Yersinia enterocolitica]AOF26591.1 hypothetical protein BED32_06695 [Yersinia enterocolitica]AOF30705.1 hypothetical protein BED35_07170 [Yersinia enterocolitica]AOF34624.1 hypothetical protein BFS78_06240 [Yersinia enterocolitica]